MMHRQIAAATVAAALAGIPATAEAGGALAPRCHALQIHGDVRTTSAYTAAQLAALPQTTINGVTGVSLDSLVPTANLKATQTRNAQLTAVLDISGYGPQRAVALGELDRDFGAHEALLTPGPGGRPTLEFPDDSNSTRSVHGVFDIAVHVVDPTTPDTPPTGGLVVHKNRGRSTVFLPAAELAALPQLTQNVSVQVGSPAVTQHHTETGPTLASVLRLLHFRARPDTAVWVTGGALPAYTAAVTPAEVRPGNRPLLISLTEDGEPLSRPRLIAAGDVTDGRYVSDAVSIILLDTAGRPAEFCGSHPGFHSDLDDATHRSRP